LSMTKLNLVSSHATFQCSLGSTGWDDYICACMCVCVCVCVCGVFMDSHERVHERQSHTELHHLTTAIQ
jgi:hypothetical protein